MIITLSLPWYKRLPPAKPGQYLAIEAPVSNGSAPLMRCYSLARWQASPRQYQLAIKREPNGKVSNWLLDHVHQGRVIRSRVPAGHFVLSEQHDQIVLVAGGVGITPVLAMLDQLRSRRTPPKSVVFFHAARTVEQLLWFDELQNWARAIDWLDYRPCLSRPHAEWPGLRGHLDRDKLATALSGWSSAALYQCASPPLMQTVEQAARSLALPGGIDVMQEAFGVAGEGSGQWFTVNAYGKQVVVQGGLSLLGELEGQVEFPDASCRAGECGGCRIRIEHGETMQLKRPQCAIDPHYVLACCTTANSDLAISLN
ncbi:MAG: iron-sulfur cluster-binding domain-containing protein [Pseudogulbenkiania sp.]|nr:iron-sulfur cluster-binding domain-containing protein [Pseudogulbenkiania sp.]